MATHVWVSVCQIPNPNNCVDCILSIDSFFSRMNYARSNHLVWCENRCTFRNIRKWLAIEFYIFVELSWLAHTRTHALTHHSIHKHAHAHTRRSLVRLVPLLITVYCVHCTLVINSLGSRIWRLYRFYSRDEIISQAMDSIICNVSHRNSFITCDQLSFYERTTHWTSWCARHHCQPFFDTKERNANGPH